jgi:hypothetical protein
MWWCGGLSQILETKRKEEKIKKGDTIKKGIEKNKKQGRVLVWKGRRGDRRPGLSQK